MDFELEKRLVIKELKAILMRLVIVTTVIAFVLGACSYINKKLHLEDDNIVEESAEAVIQHHTGMDIDLSPDSPE